MSRDADITGLLVRYQEGDAAALEDLMPLVYQELKRIARRQLSGSDLTALNTTGLVNEVYCKMAAQDRLAVSSRGHFFAVAARAMRQLLVDHLRARFAAKRNDGVRPLPLNDDQISAPDQAEFWLRVDRALQTMAQQDPRLVQILECQVFAGYSLGETAETLGVSLRTVQRDWLRAKAWLSDALEAGP
ncbi:MAG: ECF-type sigma factor [Pseudomonadota bacterium]